MHKISRTVNRTDSLNKSNGKAVYISDLERKDTLEMAVKYSDFQHGKITAVKIPPLPDGYFCVRKKDFSGSNKALIVAQDWPFFEDELIEYYGQAVLAFAGPDLEICESLCSETVIEHTELSAESEIDCAETHFNDYTIVKGAPDEAFKTAERSFEYSFRTGMQEQAYMEPQGMTADFSGNHLMIEGSMQCPYYIKNAMISAFALDSDNVRIIQSVTGGAFGGKEDYPTIIAGQVAAASKVSGKPVRLILDRREDMMVTPKRHPSLITIKTAVNTAGEISAMDIDCRLDAGAYQSLSGVVLERAIFICTGAFNIENVRVRGRTMKTNHVPSGAFRGFGGPQALFAAGMNMFALAREFKREPLDFMRPYLFKQGDHSVTGGIFRDEIKLEEMIAKIEEASGFSRKWKEYEKASSPGSPLKGIGISFAAHGGAFTGSGEQDIIKSLVRLQWQPSPPGDPQGTVTIFVSNVEMGQGASTTLRKIVAEETGMPLKNIVFTNPDTDKVPDSGPTVASRTIMIVGKLLQDAASELKTRLGGDSPVSVERRYVHPEEFEWDEETFSGDAYPGYSWAVNVIEVEIDRLTWEITITGSWAVYDVGTPIDIGILTGQMQGGTAQSLGYSSIERMQMRSGKPAQASFTDYTIPTSLDFPDTECIFVDNPYRYGPFGAKAAGELPNEGPAAAFASAVSQATGKLITYIPVSPEALEAENA